jgi:cysteine desulfurase/selenocysteine lyase
MDRLLPREEFGPLADPSRIYFDSAATSLTPQRVVAATVKYYQEVGAAAGRSAHLPAVRATALVDDARETVAAFFNCRPDEVVFTKNSTDGVNLVAAGLPWEAGDRIVVTLFEHHANLLPWMRLRDERGVAIDVVRPGADGSFACEDFLPVLAAGPKLVAFTHRSNVLGTTLPATQIIAAARAAGALTLLDAAQSAPHEAVDLDVLDPDFFVMSGHKALGPKGAGILVVRERAWDVLRPTRLGGGMITNVTLESFRPASPPTCYEAGTYDVASIHGLAEAFRLLSSLDLDRVAEHDRALGAHLYEGLGTVPGVTRFGPEDPFERTGTCAFVVDGLSPHRAASLYDSIGNIAVRSGHHCALPLATEFLHRREGTVRASLYVYNDDAEVDRFLDVTTHIVDIARKSPPRAPARTR